jgi:hypothetical protein
MLQTTALDFTQTLSASSVLWASRSDRMTGTRTTNATCSQCPVLRAVQSIHDYERGEEAFILMVCSGGFLMTEADFIEGETIGDGVLRIAQRALRHHRVGHHRELVAFARPCLGCGRVIAKVHVAVAAHRSTGGQRLDRGSGWTAETFRRAVFSRTNGRCAVCDDQSRPITSCRSLTAARTSRTTASHSAATSIWPLGASWTNCAATRAPSGSGSYTRDAMNRILFLASLLLSVAASVAPTASAEPNLKTTHECDSPLNGVGGDPFNAVGEVRANTDTSCMVAIKAIHHGTLRTDGRSLRFHTKHWTCKTQERFAEVGGERLKCRRGTKEAFEFAWTGRGG